MKRTAFRVFLLGIALAFTAALPAADKSEQSSSKSSKTTKSAKSGDSSGGKSKDASGSKPKDASGKSGDSSDKSKDSEKSKDSDKSKTAKEPTKSSGGKMLLVKAEKVSLREKPKQTADALDTLPRFSPVEMLGTEGDWTKVKTRDATGWIYNNYLARHNFVSVGAQEAPMREGPGSEETILWKVKKNYPLQVLDRQEHWLKVRDCDNSEAWIHDTNLSLDNYVVVKSQTLNLREGPGLDKSDNPKFPKRFSAQKGVIFLVLDAKEGWLKLRHKDGDEGWATAKAVWGWE